MSLTPEVWGPHYWYVFHAYASIYPENPDAIAIDVATNLIRSIPFLLPCQECAGHALKYVQEIHPKLPKIVSSRANLVQFFISFHNSVNARLGKPLL